MNFFGMAVGGEKSKIRLTLDEIKEKKLTTYYVSVKKIRHPTSPKRNRKHLAAGESPEWVARTLVQVNTSMV